MYECALVQYAVYMWVAHLAVFMYGCAIVQYAVCMWVAHPAVFYRSMLWADLAGLHAEPCGGSGPCTTTNPLFHMHGWKP